MRTTIKPNNDTINSVVFRKLKIGIQLENTRAMHFRISSNSLPNTWLRVVVSNLYSASIMKSLQQSFFTLYGTHGTHQ